MSTEECARNILDAIEKRKRNLVMTFQGKQTVFLNKFFPAFADKMVRKFFFKDGQLNK
jgi:short-subunit dehydrogenase